MASLLGNLIYAGQQTMLSTVETLGVNAAASLYSINTGALQNLDVALFQPAHQGAATGRFAAMTLPVVLYTRTGTVTVWANMNQTTVPGDILAAFFHSRIR
mgnify:CR=1 FL=1